MKIIIEQLGLTQRRSQNESFRLFPGPGWCGAFSTGDRMASYTTDHSGTRRQCLVLPVLAKLDAASLQIFEKHVLTII